MRANECMKLQETHACLHDIQFAGSSRKCLVKTPEKREIQKNAILYYTRRILFNLSVKLTTVSKDNAIGAVVCGLYIDSTGVRMSRT